MRTQLCDELDIEFPIFAFTHCRDVVAAVSKAGGFGVLGAVGFSPEELEIELQWIDEHVGDRPYGVDIDPRQVRGPGRHGPGAPRPNPPPPRSEGPLPITHNAPPPPRPPPPPPP